MDSAATSSFAFLAPYGLLYLQLATAAERTLAVDPNLTLVSLCQLSEAFARHAAARAGWLADNRDSSAKQLDWLTMLEQRGIVRDQVAEIFRMLRRVGNRAAHGFVGTHEDALHALQLGFKLACWFHRTFGDAHARGAWRPSAYAPPTDPTAAPGTLQEQATRAWADAETVAVDVVAIDIDKAPAEREQQVLADATAATLATDLDEHEARVLVDARLRDSGWEVDSRTLRWSAGAGPEMGKNCAIAEVPTWTEEGGTGIADHVKDVNRATGELLDPYATLASGRDRIPQDSNADNTTADGDDLLDRVAATTHITAISKISDRPVAKEACLVVIYGLELGKKFDLNRPQIAIGRSSKADIQIDQEAVSRNHCKIMNTGNAIILRDIGSTNGTYVNDEMIDEYVLRDGDFIKVGRCIFKFLSGNSIENAYHEEIYRLTTVDGLTQVFNRRYFVETLEREIGRALRYRRDLSLIMFDIDRFKSINDGFGHLAGDHVLKHLASAIMTRIRRDDVLARYGGEEFAIVLPQIDGYNAMQFAEKIRKLVEVAEFRFEDAVIPVTISVGVASLRGEIEDALDFIKQADSNLFAAKEGGRNRVVG